MDRKNPKFNVVDEWDLDASADDNESYEIEMDLKASMEKTMSAEAKKNIDEL